MSRPGRPRSEQAEQAIIEATLQLLSEAGMHSLSIEAVAARAGVAKTTVYRRWEGKDELVLDALSRFKGPVQTPPGDSVRGDLLYLLTHIRDQWSHGRHGRLMHQLSVEGWDRPELYVEFRDRLIRPRRRVIRDVLQRGVAEGLIRPEVDLAAVHDLLVAPILAAGFTHQKLPTRARLELYLDIVLAGVAAGPDAQSPAQHADPPSIASADR